jgi:hypothetical protein
LLEHLLEQHSAFELHAWLAGLHRPQHTLSWHFVEQHSPLELHGNQSAVHWGADEQAPLTQPPRQHWLSSVHAAPSPMQGLHAPPTQRVEQHWLSFEHCVPLPAQLDPPHTPEALHRCVQHSVGEAQGLPSVLHVPPLVLLVLLLVLVVLLLVLVLVLLDVAPPAPPMAVPLEVVELVAPPAPELLLLVLDEDEGSPNRLPSSMPHAPAAIARVTSAPAAARRRRRRRLDCPADCEDAKEAMATATLYTKGALFRRGAAPTLQSGSERI